MPSLPGGSRKLDRGERTTRVRPRGMVSSRASLALSPCSAAERPSHALAFQPLPSALPPGYLRNKVMRHLLSALVQNQPGVLAQVAGMLASRGFNIDSLAVGETNNPN